MSIRIGIAGYMGAGKSTCIKMLSNLNVVVIDADQEAKYLMCSDQRIKDALLLEFGESIYEQNSINFIKLGNIAFDSLENINRLNRIVHPPLIKELLLKMQNICKDCDCELVILDAALISLWKIDSWFDKLIWVQSSRESRLNRLLQKYKGKTNKDELIRRMNLQEQLFSPPAADKWIIVENDRSIDDIHVRITSLLSSFK
jgi:dephospho-CoA kinase